MPSNDELETRVTNLEAAVRSWDAKLQIVFNDVQGLAPQGVPMGTIIPSLLPWDVFRRVTILGDGFWLPADGRQLPEGCRYRLETGQERTFDLRGMFLRGLNSFTDDHGARSDAKRDPDTRRAGDEQVQAIAAHGHNLRFKQPSGFQKGFSGDWASNIFSEGQFNTGTTESVTPLDPQSTDTRPNNIAVYWYVKIN